MTGRKQECTEDGCTAPTVARRLCRAHYQAAWKAGVLGEHKPLPRRARNRVVCPADHKHAAASTCYIQHQCRCDACMDHHSAMESNRKKLKAYGRYDTGLVDAEPVREHVLMLGEYGIGYKRVAELAGVSRHAARNVIWGRQDPGSRFGELPKRMKRENAERILAVKPDLENLAGGQLIPARGTHRRVQALCVLGYSISNVGRRVGMEPGNFHTMLSREHVEMSTHRAVAAVFEELSMTPAPVGEWRRAGARTRAILYAQERRWLPPLAWDDIDTDVEPPVVDEVGGVDEIAVQLAISGDRVRLTPAERREAVTQLHASHLSDSAIAERLHATSRTVLRIRQELELPAAVDAAGEIVNYLTDELRQVGAESKEGAKRYWAANADLAAKQASRRTRYMKAVAA